MPTAGHLVRQAGYTQQTARTGAVTLIQRFGSALNLNIHFHMLFLDGVYELTPDGTRLRFRWVRAPTSTQLTQLAHTIARRVGRLLESEGLLERDTEQLDLGEALDTDDPMPNLVGHSITYRIAVGPHRVRKVFTLQTLPDNGWEDGPADAPGNVAGFSLHAGVAVKPSQREKKTARRLNKRQRCAGRNASSECFRSTSKPARTAADRSRSSRVSKTRRSSRGS